MKLETKFNRGDTIFYMSDNRIFKAEISTCRININTMLEVSIFYTLGVKNIWHNQNILFISKKDLVASL